MQATRSSTAIAYFTPDLFQFLRELKRNNNRDWFQRIKRKDFTVSIPLYEAKVCRADFMAMFLDALRVSAPFTEFITEALGLSF